MDLDLFNEIDDDDLLSSICYDNRTDTESADQVNVQVNCLPELNCSGEDTLNSQFSVDSFIKNSFVSVESSNDISSIIELSSYKFTSNDLSMGLVENYIFGQIRIYIQDIYVSLKGPTGVEDQLTFYQKRRQVSLLLHLICSKQSSIRWTTITRHLQNLRVLLNRLATNQVLESVCMANSCRGNEINTPAYHFLHGLLEWRLLDLKILSQKDKEEFESQFDHAMADLLILSVCLFKKKKLPDLIFTSPFACTCIKECWLVLQLLSEKMEMNFWQHFNKSMNTIQRGVEEFGLSTQAFCQFAVWIVKGLSRLQGYTPTGKFEGPQNLRVVDNYELMVETLQSFLKTAPSEEQIRTILCISMPVFLEWWTPRADVPMILWEHFHKNLNSSFYIVGAAPGNLAVSSAGGRGYTDKVKSRLQSAIPDANKSSFILFTIILGVTIERFNKAGQCNQTQKILGRIYSKFSLSKLLALNDFGIHHLIELFLTLALCAGLPEIGSKLKDTLLSIQLEKISSTKQVTLAKGHVSMLILFAEHRLCLTDYVTKFLQQLNSIKNDFAVSKIVAEGLFDIFNYSEETCFNGEHLLIGAWLPNFLQACTQAEQERTLDALHLIFKKLQSNLNMPSNESKQLMKAFEIHLLPFVKQQFPTSFAQQIVQLAADFCILLKDTEPDQYQRVFKFFTDTSSANNQAHIQFILAISQSEHGLMQLDSTTVIQIWLKSLILLTANNESVVQLTRFVCQLRDFQMICDKSEAELLTSKEPLCTFIASVGSVFSSASDFQRKCEITDKFNKLLVSFERWLHEKNEKQEMTFRFYSFIAIVIYNCAHIVYTKSKITCFFHVAMTRYVLPTTVQMGKAPDGKITQVVHKIWPVLVQGIGKLNYKTDPYVTKTLTDLIVKWTPHFKISQNSKIVSRPFLTCLRGENDALSLFVIEKLTSVFLTMQRRQADPNACLVITIFQEIVDDNTEKEDKLLIYLKASSLVTLEHLMMVDKIVPSRGMLLELLKKIVRSRAFRDSAELKGVLVEHLKVLTVKHLSYFTLFYFELLTEIANVHSPIVEDVMEFLEEQIVVVERKRGYGEDVRLRTCLEKLKGALMASKNRK